MSETSKKHKAGAPARLNYAIFICSTSRYEQCRKGEKIKDTSGDLIESSLKENGQEILFRKIISDDSLMIVQGMTNVFQNQKVDAVIFCGGTGIAPSDVTIETVTPLLDKTLPGFGETFRRLSYDEIGSAAILSRAIAGIAKGKAVFCIPGSPNAVQLCLSKLIIPETPHLVKHAKE